MRVFLAALGADCLALLAGQRSSAGGAAALRARAVGAHAVAPAGSRAGRETDGAYVVDLTTGQTLFSAGRRTPAACRPRSRSSTRPRPRCCASARTRPSPPRCSASARGIPTASGRDALPARRRRPDVRLGRLRPQRGTGPARRCTRLIGASDQSRPGSPRSRPDRRRRVVLRLAARHAGDRLRALERRRGRAERAGLRPRLRRPHGHGVPGPARRCSRPSSSRAALRAARRQACRRRRPISTGRTPAGATLLASVQSPPTRDADPADQHAVGQLLRRDAAQGHRRPLRRRRHDRRRRRGRPRRAAQRASGSTPARTTAPACRATTRRSPAQVVTAARARWPTNTAFVDSLAVAGETGRCRTRCSGTSRPGRLPRQDRHAARRRQPRRLLPARDGHTLAFAFLAQRPRQPGLSSHQIEAEHGRRARPSTTAEAAVHRVQGSSARRPGLVDHRHARAARPGRASSRGSRRRRRSRSCATPSR